MFRDPCKTCIVKPCCRIGCVLFIQYRNKYQKFMSTFTFSLAMGVISIVIMLITISGLLAGSEAYEKYEKLSTHTSGTLIFVVVINSYFKYHFFSKTNKELEKRFES